MPAQDRWEPPGPVRELSVSPRKEVAQFVAQTRGIRIWPAGLGGRTCRRYPRVPETSSRIRGPRAAGGRVRAGTATARLWAAGARPWLAGSLWLPAAAAARASPAAERSQGHICGQVSRPVVDPRDADRRNGRLDFWASAWGPDAGVGLTTAWPCPLLIPGNLLACPDFVPSLFHAGKVMGATPGSKRLALMTLTQKKQPSYPTSWSAEAEVGWMLQLQEDSAWRRAPVQGRSRMQHFKVSQSIQLHPGSWAGDKQN